MKCPPWTDGQCDQMEKAHADQMWDKLSCSMYDKYGDEMMVPVRGIFLLANLLYR